MICHYCGTEIKENSLHCQNCGAPLDSVTQQLIRFRQETQSLPSAESKKRPVQPVRHSMEHALRSHRILMIIAIGLAGAIVVILLLSLLL